MYLAIYIIFVVAVFYWQAKLIRSGKRSKVKAIGLHLLYTISPIIIYGAVFFALVGIEELTGTAIIGEGYARTLPIIIVGGVGISLLATVVFSLLAIFLKQGPDKDA